MIATIIHIIVWLVFLKAITIGSNFSFYKYFRYGKSYWKWYMKYGQPSYWHECDKVEEKRPFNVYRDNYHDYYVHGNEKL